MVRTRPRVLTIGLVMVTLQAACQPASPGPSGPPSANASVAPSTAPSAAPSASTPGAGREPLAQVLDFLTLDTMNVAFTDWVGIKAAYGVGDLTSADPLEDRLAFMDATVPPSATDAPYACFACREYRFDGLKTNWGFDNMDLAWEAEIQQRRALVVVLRFSDEADLAPLISRFDERGFSTELRDGATIRVHAMDQSDWIINTGGRAMLNAAFLADGQTLLLGTTLTGLESALSQEAPLPALRSAPVLTDAVAALEGPTSAFLTFDLDPLCNPFLRMPPNAERQAIVESLLERAGALHPYTVMAVGNRGSLTPTGRIVFGYGDPGEAEADLVGRRLLVEEGVSLLFALGRPLSEFITLVDAQAAGGNLILSVGPGAPSTPLPSGAGSPGTAFYLLRVLNDAIFAACDISL